MQQATFKAAVWLALVWEALLVGMVWGQTSAEKVKVDLTAEPLLEKWSVGKATEYTRSPKINDELSTYVGTVYVISALSVCGEIP